MITLLNVLFGLAAGVASIPVVALLVITTFGPIFVMVDGLLEELQRYRSIKAAKALFTKHTMLTNTTGACRLDWTIYCKAGDLTLEVIRVDKKEVAVRVHDYYEFEDEPVRLLSFKNINPDHWRRLTAQDIIDRKMKEAK